jgi:hypothetical protein
LILLANVMVRGISGTTEPVEHLQFARIREALIVFRRNIIKEQTCHTSYDH